jgi:hypothetical protein
LLVGTNFFVLKQAFLCIRIPGTGFFLSVSVVSAVETENAGDDAGKLLVDALPWLWDSGVG